MTKVINNIEEAKALSVEIQKEINKLKTTLNTLETNITLIQSGDI